MPYLYLIGATIFISVINLLGTGYNRKNAGEQNLAPLYNLILSSAACATWGIIYAFDFSFEPKALLYSLGFGVSYVVAMLALIKALSVGSTSLTSLAAKLSLIGTTVWGFLFWGTWNVQRAPLILTGLGLVVVSLCLCLYSDKKSDQKISWRWIVYAFLCFLGNAGCSIFQKSEQIAFNGEHGSMFMFFSMALSTLICAVVFFLGKKPNLRKVMQGSLIYPVCAGASNALGNLFVVLLATSVLSPNLIYPAIAVGGLAITSVLSIFLFKEKLAWWQWIGVAVGAVAVVLLSIG